MVDLREEFDLALRRAFAHAMRDARGEAVRRSSGPYSSEELADMDHPYARRHGAPQLDPGLINVQTGDFLRSWRRPEIMRSGNDLAGRIVNDDPKADWIKAGNRYTFDRPIEQETEIYAEHATETRVRSALREFGRRRIVIQ